MKSYLSGFHLIKRVMHAAHYNAVYRLTSLGPKPDYSMPHHVTWEDRPVVMHALCIMHTALQLCLHNR